MANTPIQLIVGLGNPGDKYAHTRHNAGFWFIDQLARHYHVTLRSESKFRADAGGFDVQGRRVWLLKPTTFMNLSGEALAPFARYYQIAPENTLVIHDELDLPPGTARLKWSGGHGGHNGLRDIFKHYTRDFWRLRIGIGHPGNSAQVLSFVMQSPSRQEQSLIDESIDRVITTMPDVLDGNLDAAMRKLHQKSNA